VRRIIALIAVLSMTMGLVSCAMDTKQQQGTAIGAGVGAIAGAALGQAIGRDTKGTVLGAAIGAAVGGLAGNQIGAYMDRQEQELRNAIAAANASTAAAEAASVEREADVLTATFKSDVFFGSGSAVLFPGAHPELDRVANVLNRYPQTMIRIEGHTDTTGRADHNQVLSEKRAKAVADALYQRNVSPERISTIGYGESQPISSDHAMNRRVSIVITPIRQG
jgi:outer membrane protein OmpA-like peptidoglycan-associated protein